MRLRKYIIQLPLTLAIFACSNGAGREINNNDYGNLQSTPTQITIGGASSSTTLDVGFFQSYLESMVCPGIDLANSVLDTASGHTGRDVCNTNESYINGNTSIFGAVSNNLDTFISGNTAGVTGVNMYRITYNTQGQPYYFSGGTVTNETVSGLVIVPQGIISSSTVKGIVLYYHPTALSKFNVPSYQDVYSQLMLASIYASQGYIVVAPDYVGQGIDSSVMHPYVLYAQNNALAGLNMLKATRQFLASSSSPLSTPQSQNLGLYITSYSEGGAYALWASRMVQGASAYTLTNSSTKLQRTVGISGAYDLSNVMIPYAYTNANNSVGSANIYNANPGILESSPYYLGDNAFGGLLPVESGIQKFIANLNMATSKASLASYAFSAFITYNFAPAAYRQFFPNGNFLNMSHCLNISSYLASVLSGGQSIVESACPIQDSLSNIFMNADASYNDTNIGLTIVSSAMYNTNFFTAGESAGAMISNIYGGGVSFNSVGMFASTVLNDPNLMSYIKAADTWSYVAESKTSIIYLAYDSTVTNLDSIKACSSSGVKGLSATNMVTCVPIDNSNMYSAMDLTSFVGTPVQLALMLDHALAFYIANLAALNQITTNP